MLGKRANLRFFAVLLAILFLGVQFHFCADFTPGPTGTHLCPVCSAAVSVVASSAPVISLVPIVNRLETIATIQVLPLFVHQLISSRAPPAL